MEVGGERKDFFVSHAGVDRAWAEWAAWHLTEAGYQVELDVWDWAAGQNFVTKMSDALGRCDRVLALWSAEYFNPSRYTSQEWSAALALAPDRLVPVRIENVPADQVPGILRPLASKDLFGLREDQARRMLLEAVSGPSRPGQAPHFPGRDTPVPRSGAEPRLPGTLPPVWNLPQRNAIFTGRDTLLVEVRERLLAGDRAVVQALHGMGGVGKTQLAIEYAYQFASSYDVVWWIPAERPGLIVDQVAALATALGCADQDAKAPSAAGAALANLRTRARWLLLFDNAEAARDLLPWLPGGAAGHVLITTRTSGWHEIAAHPVEVDVFARPESAAILRERVPGLAEADALAAELGDLPLAIAQAASYMAESAMPARTYLHLLRTRAAQILDEGDLVSYPHSLAGATQLTLERLTAMAPAAAQLAQLCAFLAPEPIPLALFPAAAAQLPEPLAASAADPLPWHNLLTALARSALARIDEDVTQLHRLTQAVLRDQLGPDRAATRALAGTVLAASHPGDPADPVSWPGWAGFMPHILAIDPAASSDPAVCDLANDATWYLLMRGDTVGGLALATHLHEAWTSQLGRDDPATLRAAAGIAQALRQQRRYAEARRIDEDTLAAQRRVLGEDHPLPLRSASNLATDLASVGEVRAARELNETLLARRRLILGENHLDTLVSATNLAANLSGLGEYLAARELNEDLLARRRLVRGEDHPHTLITASNLAAVLTELGELQAARELDEDTLARRRRVLGDDHPDTLLSAINLAINLIHLKEYQLVRELEEDTLPRCRRVLGDDDARTLTSAGNLATSLAHLGDHQAARELEEDILARRRRLLGDDHPDTLLTAGNLAIDLRALGEHQAARALEEEITRRQ